LGDQQDKLDSMFRVYSETVLQQRGVFASLGLLQNHPRVMADLAARIVQLARNFAMNNGTTRNGVYLGAFYILGQDSKQWWNGAFIKYKGKNVIEYIHKWYNVKSHPTSKLVSIVTTICH